MTEHVEPGTGLVVAGIVIFALAYAAIASDRVPKSAVAVAGAVLMIMIGIMDQHHGFEHIDLNVIFLLVGMMVLAGLISETGAFQYLAIVTVQRTGGNGFHLAVALSVITAVLSAFLDNVTTVILIAPITLVVARQLHINPVPLFIAEILASNIGGAATLIGDPPNILIGSAGNIDFAEFAAHMTPPILIMLPLFLVSLRWMFGKQLAVDPVHAAALAKLDPAEYITDRRGLKIGLAVLGLTVVGFLIHGALNWEPATIALGGAALAMLLLRANPHKAFAAVEWPSVMFFVGLFVMVGGLVELGVLDAVANFIRDLTQGNVFATAALTIWVSGVASAIVDNIPFAATMLPVVQNLEAAGLNPDNILWWSLALGADLGGNATIIGASANVILAGIAEREGYKIGFVQFMKYGVPVAVVCMALSTVWIWVRYVAFA